MVNTPLSGGPDGGKPKRVRWTYGTASGARNYASPKFDVIAALVAEKRDCRHIVFLENNAAHFWLRERIAALTKSLPPEDARLDALVAYRVGAMGNFKPDRAHGAAVFAMNCALCHRFRDAGGNLGPSLDGIASRALPRLVEDILDPNRNVDPMFRMTTLPDLPPAAASAMNTLL